MKTMANTFRQQLTAVSAAVLLWGASASALAQNSPVGSWDLVLSGHEQGLAQITFNADFTLDGFEIMTTIPRNSKVNLRGSSGRVPITTNTIIIVSNIIARATLNGFWAFDSRGNVIGLINEVAPPLAFSVSFRAVVRPGVRISMGGTRAGGRVSYRGVPLNALVDMSGNFYDSGRRAGVAFNEVFTLTPTLGAAPNDYTVAGSGPGYSFAGRMLVSGLRKAAMFVNSDETVDGTLNVVSGPFSFTTGRGTLTGTSSNPDPSKDFLNLIKRVGR